MFCLHAARRFHNTIINDSPKSWKSRRMFIFLRYKYKSLCLTDIRRYTFSHAVWHLLTECFCYRTSDTLYKWILNSWISDNYSFIFIIKLNLQNMREFTHHTDIWIYVFLTFNHILEISWISLLVYKHKWNIVTFAMQWVYKLDLKSGENRWEAKTVRAFK